MQQSPALGLRRVLYRWQFAAVVVLPAWLLVGWASFGSGGWELLLVMLASGALGIALLAALGLVLARRSVRTARAVSPTDAIAMGVLTLAVIGTGTFSVVSTWCAVVAVLAVVALVAMAVRQLLAETRQRMQEVIAVIERDAQPRPPEWKAAEGPDAGRTIRLD
ncbi:hypothetical protein [Clavibacter michiganensis]|uniref:Hypothetical membrane protein n=1 Tax=Clavibacter michiganensis subsp. michiganensis (strain NCPPB 382) TaxID=443906 RepID=A5CQR3_CLAM3|nr:hypothetical protein [Clavibacter michiganensis]KAF0258197.1 hypothetical protein DOU02_09610 [Clavibacter michiganensis subsp. michiganensis]MBF4636629.1 hypothetical protein [Clavibacter michiganensis subsp. michiganensis]MBW8026393.1 hypothetical protein [Clavibacter michiganensis subsp. michiganensis]MDO4026158.1 hypothetical protein [Clavibacter michiganensis]MDO4030584.1 hypothetical protein [Clavibacter michiganensis]